VGVIGVCFGLAANQLSPRGINLGYIPPALTNVVVNVPTNTPGGSTNKLSPTEHLIAKLRANGLQYADSNMVTLLYQDPRYQQELVIFIDARDDRHYQEGHVPGAYQFDPWRKDNYLPTVLPVCMTAQQIVVYCNGGDCDDSQVAAVELRNAELQNAGVPSDKFFVYGGGMTEWITNQLPVEIGIRKSGNIRTNFPAPVKQAASK